MDRTIAYLTSQYARASDTFIRREIEELRRLGWTVHTFSIRRPDEGGPVPEDVLRERRTTDYVLERGLPRLLLSLLRAALRSPRRMLRAIGQVRAVRWPGLGSWMRHGVYLAEAAYLAEQLAARKVKLLHDHIAMNSATVAMLAATLSDVPFSMTVHGLELLSAEQWALGAKVAASAFTACVSSHGKAQCMLFTPPAFWEKLHEVRCGLEGTFLDGPADPPPDSTRLVCVGRLSPEKGQLLLVQAARALKDQGVEAEIVLVGDGPSRSEIERAASALGVAGAIRIAGTKSSADVRRLILESRAVVLPSFSEGLPVVLMEALALRRPAIATHVGGVPELIRPGESGWLVPPGSAGDLARAMREALRTPVEELQRMGERGRLRVLERHDLSAEVGKLAGLLEGAMRAGTPPDGSASA